MAKYLQVYKRSEKAKPVRMFKPGCEPQSFAAAALANNNAPQILDLPQMQFNEGESTNNQPETVTSNGVPLLGLPSMNFEKPKPTKQPKPATSDSYMANLPSMDFDDNR